MTSILCTGSAGFIGAHLVDYLLKNTDWQIHVWDCLNYSSREAWRLRKIGAFDMPNFQFANVDLADLKAKPINFDYVAHLAAETHVDRSIEEPTPFIQSNIFGTFRLLQYARQMPGLKKFLYFSTDEVYGPAGEETFSENSAHNPTNPYSASKDAGESLALAWANTYNLPVVVSHCSNVFGEMQNSEKYIPKLVQAITCGHNIGIHVNETGESGRRQYVYAGDVAHAIDLLLKYGEPRKKYNIPGKEVSNEEMAHMVAEALEMDLISSKESPYTARPGWDFNYRISGDELGFLGWEPTDNFKALLKQTVDSYDMRKNF